MHIDILSGTHDHHFNSPEISPHHSKFKWCFIKQNKNRVLNFFYVLTPNNAIVERFLTRLCLCAFVSFRLVYSYFIDFPVTYPSSASNAEICLISSPVLTRFWNVFACTYQCANVAIRSLSLSFSSWYFEAAFGNFPFDPLKISMWLLQISLAF